MLLSIENVTFRYPKASRDALRGVSFSVPQGEFAVLCGLSGCGKSTLLRLIKRELAPFGGLSGRILADGTDLTKGTAPSESSADLFSARTIGIVLQDPESQIVTDTVWHELAFGLENLGLPSEVIRRRVAEMAAFFGIEGWYHKKTYELSGGQKQLLNLAAVLAMNPQLLLLDEPTAQLDPIAAADFRNMLTRINRDLGVTILMAEHRLEQVLPLTDHVLLLDRGELLCDGSPAELAAFVHSNHHPMASALPTATRVYLALQNTLPGPDSSASGSSDTPARGIPLTVRDGRALLSAATDRRSPSGDAAEAAATGSETPALAASGVRFRYDKNLPDALCDTTLCVSAGEHYCLLGGNGSGKTTLLSLLAGLKRPYAGSVKLFGKKLSAFATGTLYRENLALLPQQPRDVFTEKSIREDLLGAFSRACSFADAKASASAVADKANADMLAMCERLHITDILDSHPYDVSGGELQKAALAKVLASRPKVLLLDEPAKGIDVCGKDELAAILKELTAEGVAVLSVTHDAEWAAEHADRCGLLFDGEVISEGTPHAFFDGNAFYTTAANRMAGDLFPGVVTCEELIRAMSGSGAGEGSSRATEVSP